MRVDFALFVKVFLHSGLILLACYEHAATLGGDLCHLADQGQEVRRKTIAAVWDCGGQGCT